MSGSVNSLAPPKCSGWTRNLLLICTHGLSDNDAWTGISGAMEQQPALINTDEPA